MQPIPVIVFNDEPYQKGNGLYKRIACFTDFGIHVIFFYEVYNGREYINFIKEVVKCDGSCEQRVGEMHNFSEARPDTIYDVRKIIAKALAYRKTVVTPQTEEE